MLQNDFVPIWAVSIGVMVPLVAVVGVCICGCKKTVPKSDLHGLPGMVKITNPDDASNNQTLAIEVRDNNAGGGTAVSTEACDMSRRSSATVNRSLPAIPSGGIGGGVGVGVAVGDALWESEANGDTGSELYATVGDKNLDSQASEPLVALDEGGSKKRMTGSSVEMAAGTTAVASRDGGGSNCAIVAGSHSDDSVHYDCLKTEHEHPYDRLKKNEHPYAQVQGASSSGGIGSGSSGACLAQGSISSQRSSVDGSEGSGADSVPSNPVPPPRARRSVSAVARAAVEPEESAGAGPVAGAATTGPSLEEGIAAATAIAGRVAASQELPYMTPPLPAPPPPPTHFSGDSHDSKGYTSISVREPLASIKAQTKGFNQSLSSHMQDSHYATVSDDSDEMYAAIEDPVQLYNSGSETYAQIQPMGSAEASVYPPQPPSVDSLKHVANAHSRQASSSSASSSVANLGSPKPEKRQANSPLPPPPCGSPDKGGDKLLGPPVGEVMNLEEMYAKVMKKKHTTEANASTSTSVNEHEGTTLPLNLTDFQKSSYSAQEGARTDINFDRFSVSDLTSKKDSISSEQDGQLQMQERNVSDFVNSDQQVPCASNVNKSHQYFDPGYEVVLTRQASENVSTSEKKAGKVPCEDESYSSPTDSNTYNNNSSESNSTYSLRRVTNDSNNNSNTEDSIYPKYESVLPAVFTSESGRNDSPFFSDEISEPNYESMPSEETELNYSGVLGASGSSELDPNYEVVEHDDPNYESVSYMETNNDPPYERLHNEVRDSDSGPDHNYELARQCNRGVTISHDKGVGELPNSEPGYEEIGLQKNKVCNELEPKGDELTSVSSM